MRINTMNKTETTYTYNKETDTLTTTITTTISFQFTQYHRILILKAYREGYVEIRGDFENTYFHNALRELINIGIMEEDTDAWYFMGLLKNKEKALEFCRNYTEEE